MAITQVPIGTPSGLYVFEDSAMGSTADAVKATGATLYSAVIDNSLNASPVYVKLYNLASGGVTPGTTDPDEIIYVPASTIVSQTYYTSGAAGRSFGTALTARCVTAGGTGGTTAPSSSVPVTLTYA